MVKQLEVVTKKISSRNLVGFWWTQQYHKEEKDEDNKWPNGKDHLNQG